MTRQKNIAMTWGVFPMIFLLVMLFGVDSSSIKTIWICLIFVLLSYFSMPLAYYGFSKEGFSSLTLYFTICILYVFYHRVVSCYRFPYVLERQAQSFTCCPTRDMRSLSNNIFIDISIQSIIYRYH